MGNTRIHERRHTGDKPYPCPLCPFASVTSSATNAHLKSMHQGECEALKPSLASRLGGPQAAASGPGAGKSGESLTPLPVPVASSDPHPDSDPHHDSDDGGPTGTGSSSGSRPQAQIESTSPTNVRLPDCSLTRSGGRAKSDSSVGVSGTPQAVDASGRAGHSDSVSEVPVEHPPEVDTGSLAAAAAPTQGAKAAASASGCK